MFLIELLVLKSNTWNHLTVRKQANVKKNKLVGWFLGVYGISTFLVFLMPNLFLYK